MPSLLISIIITAHNSGVYLSKALESAVTQDWINREIILVDDGSDAIGAKSIENYASVFPEVRIIRQNNQGLSAARNTGASVASGQYLAFLDHDDIWRPTFLSTLVAMLDRNDMGATFSAIEHMAESGRPLGEFSKPKIVGLTVQDFLISDPVGCGSSFMIKGTAFNSVQGFDKNLRRAETPDLFIRLIANGWHIQGTTSPLVLYRNTPGSLSSGAELKAARHKVWEKTIAAHPEFKALDRGWMWIFMQINLFKIQVRRLRLSLRDKTI